MSTTGRERPASADAGRGHRRALRVVDEQHARPPRPPSASGAEALRSGQERRAACGRSSRPPRQAPARPARSARCVARRASGPTPERAARRRARATVSACPSRASPRSTRPQASSDSGTPRRRSARRVPGSHRERTRIVAVEHLDAAAVKDARLGGGVLVHSGVTVEVIVRDVEHRGRGRRKRGGRLELEARQLQNEDVRPGPARPPEGDCAPAGGQRADRAWGSFQSLPAGSMSSTASPMLPATTVARPEARQSAPESAVTVDLPFEPVIASTFCSGGSARAKSSMSPTSSTPPATAAAIGRLVLGDAGTDRDQIGAGERMRGERSGGHLDARQRRGEIGGERRRRPGVRDAHDRPARRKMASEREPGEPESQHDGVASRVVHDQRPPGAANKVSGGSFSARPAEGRCAPPRGAANKVSVGVVHLPARPSEGRCAPPRGAANKVSVGVVHLSFSVERPNSTSSIVMIQKRTTTWFSFQPLSS